MEPHRRVSRTVLTQHYFRNFPLSHQPFHLYGVRIPVRLSFRLSVYPPPPPSFLTNSFTSLFPYRCPRPYFSRFRPVCFTTIDVLLPIRLQLSFPQRAPSIPVHKTKVITPVFPFLNCSLPNDGPPLIYCVVTRPTPKSMSLSPQKT